MTFGVVLFPTTTSAIRAEKILIKAGLAVKLVPTPRELSSDCGISLRFLPADEADLRLNLDQAHLEFEIFFLEKN
jgi:hypothetical protein